jgi:putative nucleotidyltransferase with HDIG domain
MDLQPGDRLIQDSYNSSGLYLLSADTILERDDIDILFKHLVDYVEIEPRVQGNPNNLQGSRAIASFQQAMSGVRTIFQSAIENDKVEEATVNAHFEPLIKAVCESKDMVELLLDLDSRDEYTMQHSVQVSVISYFIALWLGKSEIEAQMIGKAGYLHDIGKCKIDIAILNKPGKLSEQEFIEIAKHTIYGYDIIRRSISNEELALAALEHHERMDGSGYPLKRKGEDIHLYARIVAVADIYSAMISNRAYSKKRDLLYVLKELHTMSFGQLDPIIVQVFIKHMIPNFIGKKMTLTNGMTGTIVMTNPSSYFHPLVKINDEFIDMANRSDLEISTITL